MRLEDFINLAVWGGTFAIVVIRFFRSLCLVPTKTVYIVERFGKYHKTLGAGFHALIPFMDKVAFIHDLKEETIDVPPQECFSKDEVYVTVDGVIYISVTDAAKASYGVTDYRYAAVQLAQTTTRSVVGTLDLDKLLEERDMISAKVVEVLDRAGESWGMRVHRYEIKNIQPPETVRNAMEKQVTAERERRAILAKSEGDKQRRINLSEGEMMEMVNVSEGEMTRQINEAQGRAEEILTLATATAESIEKVALSVSSPGGEAAVKMKMAEKLFKKLGKIADRDTRVILPADVSNFDGWIKKLGL